MERNTVFKQNVWNFMYGKNGSSEHSDSEGEITPPIQAEKTVREVKTYSVLPPPADYTPTEPLEDNKGEDEPSDSSSKREKSDEQQDVFDELNKSLSLLDDHSKEIESQLNIIHNIKRLILLGDMKSAGDLMSSMKSDGCFMSEGVNHLIIRLFEYWMKDISDKG